MNFRVLLTTSCIQQDPKFLMKLDDELLDESERVAKKMCLKYHAKHGKLPTVNMLRAKDETVLFVDETYYNETISALFDEARNYLVARYLARSTAEMREEYDTTGKYPIDRLMEVSKFVSKSYAVDFDDLDDIDCDKMYSDQNLAGGVEFGFSTIDVQSGGLLPGELGLLAARMGVGKSLIACRQAVRWARSGKKVLLISSEMSNFDLTGRIHAMLAGFNPRIFRERGMEAVRRSYLPVVQSELKIIQDAGGKIMFPRERVITIGSLISSVMERQPDVVIVDGIYLIRSSNNKTSAGWEKLKEISNELKQLALGEEIPIFATTQLKRTGKDEDYTLEDIAYSDALAQDSDLVMLATKKNGLAYHRISVDIAKNRHGESFGGIEIEIDWSISRIEEVPSTITSISLGGGHSHATIATI